MGLREPTEKELKTIFSAFRAYGFELNGKEILIREVTRGKNKIKEVILLSKDLFDFINDSSLPDKFHEKLCFTGIKVGEVGKRFRFSLEGCFYIARKKRKRVYVNDKGEMLFLYGRDLFSISIVKVTEDVRENDIVMVCNKDGDILGIGKSRFDSEVIRSVEADRVVVENLIDRGEYLRKSKLYSAF